MMPSLAVKDAAAAVDTLASCDAIAASDQRCAALALSTVGAAVEPASAASFPSLRLRFRWGSSGGGVDGAPAWDSLPLPPPAAALSSVTAAAASCTDKADKAGVPTAARAQRQPYRINLTKEEAPAHVIYPYVLTGYRAGGTYARCTAALFELHTETFNAWTMIWGACLSSLLLWRTVGMTGAWGAAHASSGAAHAASAVGGDGVPFVLLTTAVLLHAPFSIAFHLYRCICRDTYNLWRRLDQFFIFQVSQLLTVGIGWFVYESWWGLAANAAAAFVIAQVASVDISRLPADFQRNRTHMVAFVATIVLCYFWPMGVQTTRDLAAWAPVAAAWLSGSPAAVAAAAAAAPSLAAVGWSFATFASLAAGAGVFAAGFPERAFPRTFDRCGFSHQLMHVFAALAHVFEYAFVLDMWARRRGAPPDKHGLALLGLA